MLSLDREKVRPQIGGSSVVATNALDVVAHQPSVGVGDIILCK